MKRTRKNKTFWAESWIQHIDRYLQSAPRTGFFIHRHFKNIKTILEIAGGSCRDSGYLASHYSVTATDFDEKTLRFLKQHRFSKNSLKYIVADAFDLCFQENSFDLVFHNGFFIYFNDEDILKMLKEQARISKKYIVIFIHNGENEELIKKFREKAEKDKLFEIRFFNKNVIVDIVKNSGIKIKSYGIVKFGGFFDVFYKNKFKKIIPNILKPFGKYFVPYLYQLQNWEKTERICCIIELDK